MEQHGQAHSDQPLGTAPRQPTLLVGAEDGTVALLRARTGAVVWRTASCREVGTLAHDGTRCYVALGSRLRLVRGSRYETVEQRLRREQRLRAEPARLEARSAEDGRLLWRRKDWNLFSRLDVGVGSDVVVVASTSHDPRYGDGTLYGLDARTGATRWTVPASGQYQIDGHRFAVRTERVYVYGEDGDHDGLLVLDVQTGEPVWRRDSMPDLALSPRGRFAVEQRLRRDETMRIPINTVQVLDPATGIPRHEYTLHGYIRVATDDGMGYGSTISYEEPGLVARRVEDGSELWLVDNVLTYQLAASGPTVYCAHLVEREGVGEVEAFDALSGRRLWHRHTPASLSELFQLWGMRTPWMLAVSGVRIGVTLGTTLAQPSPREIGIDLLHELRYGQWRRPYGLHGAVNAMWLVAGLGAVYLGTRLGVFALGAEDGRLLWHALPSTDLSFIAPALTPE
jgi:PQQ-like domain